MRTNKEIIWTSNIAYAVGLFVADGCLSNDGRHLEFTSKDLVQVTNFSKYLGLQNRISDKSNGYTINRRYFRIQFGDIALYKFLNNIGIEKKKSLTISAILIPHEFFPDFLRGLLDGDGSISISKHPESKKLQVKTRFASGSKPFLEWLGKTIKSQTKVLGGFISQATRCYQLTYAKADSIKLTNFMYYNDDVVCLSRKRETAEFVLRLQQEENNVYYS